MLNVRFAVVVAMLAVPVTGCGPGAAVQKGGLVDNGSQDAVVPPPGGAPAVYSAKPTAPTEAALVKAEPKK